MTEKRFRMETERINNTYCCRILEKENILFEVNNWGGLSQSNNKEMEELVNRLNELHETNEQLQRDATTLIHSNQDYRKENEHLKQSFNEVLKDLEVRAFDKELLEKENEQLKKELDQFYLLIGRGDWSGLMDLLIDDEKCKTKYVKSIK